MKTIRLILILLASAQTTSAADVIGVILDSKSKKRFWVQLLV